MSTRLEDAAFDLLALWEDPTSPLQARTIADMKRCCDAFAQLNDALREVRETRYEAEFLQVSGGGNGSRVN